MPGIVYVLSVVPNICWLARVVVAPWPKAAEPAKFALAFCPTTVVLSPLAEAPWPITTALFAVSLPPANCPITTELLPFARAVPPRTVVLLKVGLMKPPIATLSLPSPELDKLPIAIPASPPAKAFVPIAIDSVPFAMVLPRLPMPIAMLRLPEASTLSIAAVDSPAAKLFSPEAVTPAPQAPLPATAVDPLAGEHTNCACASLAANASPSIPAASATSLQVYADIDFLRTGRTGRNTAAP